VGPALAGETRYAWNTGGLLGDRTSDSGGPNQHHEAYNPMAEPSAAPSDTRGKALTATAYARSNCTAAFSWITVP